LLISGINATKWLATHPVDTKSASTAMNKPELADPLRSAASSIVTNADRPIDPFDEDTDSPPPRALRGRPTKPYSRCALGNYSRGIPSCRPLQPARKHMPHWPKSRPGFGSTWFGEQIPLLEIQEGR
jgi:hypothetical protein